MDGNSITSSQLGQTPSKSHQSSSGSSSSTGSDEEDSEESESSSTSKSKSKALRNFREKWRTELKEPKSTKSKSDVKLQPNPNQAQPSTPTPENLSHEPDHDLDPEEEAKRLFQMGVGLERTGDLYEAVRFYRRAMQLVPDIETRVNQNETPADESRAGSSDSEGDDEPMPDGDGAGTENGDEDENSDLVAKFMRIIEANGWHFFEKNRPDSKAHLDDIPVEVMTYILRWVISDELDMRSLEVLSRVCRGFYCLSRDEDLWKLACDRVWDSKNYVGSVSEFSTYREMFISRPRPRLDGCYISKVTYVRPGEHSFQDQSYRPWHLVEYFRYLRFFPDGQLYFLTSSDQPSVTVSGFKDQQHPRNPATMQGKYRLYGDNLISAVVTKPNTNYRAGRMSSKLRSTGQPTTTFHIDLEIQTLRGRPNWMLRWTGYSVFIARSAEPAGNHRNQNNNDGVAPASVTSTFDLSPNKFPPLYFSRVKSYTSRSENILT